MYFEKGASLLSPSRTDIRKRDTVRHTMDETTIFNTMSVSVARLSQEARRTKLLLTETDSPGDSEEATFATCINMEERLESTSQSDVAKKGQYSRSVSVAKRAKISWKLRRRSETVDRTVQVQQVGTLFTETL